MIVCLGIYKLDKLYPKIQKELEDRRKAVEEKISTENES